MKKYFIIAFAFVAGLAMTSCNDKKNTPTESAKISFVQKAYELSVGETQRLSVTITPSGTQLQVKYASSDASVASVSVSGIVTAEAEGEAMIIATAEGAEGDTCYIKVSDDAVYNSLEIAGYGLFGEGWQMIEGTDSTLTWPDGTKYDVQLGQITLIAWDGNLVYSKGSGWGGAGLAIQAPVTFWVITGAYTEEDQKYIGAYIGHGGFEIYDLQGKPAHGAGQSGAVNVQDYGDFLKSYIAATKSEEVDWAKMESAFTGAQVVYADYSDSENPTWSDSYGQFYGHINSCYFFDADEELGFDAGWFVNVSWHDFTSGRYFGMDVNRDEEGYLESVVEPYDFVTVDRTLQSENWEDWYNYLTQESSRKPHIISSATIHKELPAFAKGNKALDKMYKK